MNKQILKNLEGARLKVTQSDGEIIINHPIKKARFSANILQIFTDAKYSEWVIAGGQITINSNSGKITKISQSGPLVEEIIY